MRRLPIAAILLVAPVVALASSGHVTVEDAKIDLSDKASLQRGAKTFVNHCMGCHSMKYMRYNRMAQDLGIDEVTLRQNLIFGDAKPGDPMVSALRPTDGVSWFGTAVPDLTLVTRWRSPDWVYTYLKSYYVDPKRPYGVNNLMFPDVGMPHVLAPLQGVQHLVHTKDEHGGDTGHTELKLVEKGSLTPEEYDTLVRDLTNFLTYAGEPIRLERQALGIYVLLFIGIFFIVSLALKKEYWKDVH